jgi:hypothetical protein
MTLTEHTQRITERQFIRRQLKCSYPKRLRQINRLPKIEQIRVIDMLRAIDTKEYRL